MNQSPHLTTLLKHYSDKRLRNCHASEKYEIHPLKTAAVRKSTPIQFEPEIKFFFFPSLHYCLCIRYTLCVRHDGLYNLMRSKYTLRTVYRHRQRVRQCDAHSFHRHEIL